MEARSTRPQVCYHVKARRFARKARAAGGGAAGGGLVAERVRSELRTVRVEKDEHTQSVGPTNGTRAKQHTKQHTCKLGLCVCVVCDVCKGPIARALWDAVRVARVPPPVRPCTAYAAVRASALTRESAPPRAVVSPPRSPKAHTRRPLLGWEEASLPGVASVRASVCL